MNTKPGVPVWESLNIEILKHGHGSSGTQIRERLRWRGPATSQSDRPDLSSEVTPCQKTRNCLKTDPIEQKFWVPDTKIDWPNDRRRNINEALT
jgi:hypothetical protein